MERTERIARTIRFLNDAFQDSDYLSAHPDAKAYRLEHTYRVAHIGCAIAEAEGMDAEAMTIGCLLHDVSYCLPFDSDDAVLEHGRRSARMARPLLETFDLAPETRLPVALYWHCWNLDSPLLDRLTRAVIAAADTALRRT